MTTPTHDTTSPTREEVARALVDLSFGHPADAILALFAPALAAAEKRGMERAITLCAPHEDDDAMDRQAKAHCVVAIRAEMEKM